MIQYSRCADICVRIEDKADRFSKSIGVSKDISRERTLRAMLVTGAGDAVVIYRIVYLPADNIEGGVAEVVFGPRLFEKRHASQAVPGLSLIHISEPTRQAEISYA